MLRIWLLAWRKNSLTASDFHFWEKSVNSAFCILHSAFPQSPPIFSSGNFSKLPKLPKLSNAPNAPNASNASNASNAFLH